MGKKVIEQRNIDNNYLLDLSGKSKGTYVLQLTSESKIATKMLLVK
jgi:hypothetical protein